MEYYDLELMAKNVNDTLKAEAVDLQLGTKISLGRLEETKSDPTTFSYWAELEFMEFCRRQLEKHSPLSGTYLINNGARKLRLSPVTTKRYMAKLRGDNGPLLGLGDGVQINPHYVPVEQDDYWLDPDDDERLKRPSRRKVKPPMVMQMVEGAMEEAAARKEAGTDV